MEKPKKIKNIIYIIIAIVAIILAILIVGFARKFVIVTNIAKKVENLKTIKTYYAKSAQYGYDNVYICESKVDNGKVLTNMKAISLTDNNDAEWIMYKNTEENTALLLFENGESAERYKNIEEAPIITVGITTTRISTFQDSSIFEKISCIKGIKNITKTEYNGKECYLIIGKHGRQELIEKDTGLTMRSTDGGDVIHEYKYDINAKLEVKQPDLSGYTVRNVENNSIKDN